MGVRDFYVARQRSARKPVNEIYVSTGSRIHRKPVIDRCKIPVQDGDGLRMCGHPRFEGEEEMRFVRHVAQHAQEAHDLIVAMREQQHPEIMRPWDTELDKWIAQHRRALIEGRMQI
jgi:hypothetical protein